MIFSLSSLESPIDIFDQGSIDTFCFFKNKNSVICPEDNWIEYVFASLRNKKNVLILSSKIKKFPTDYSNQRWLVTEDYIWLMPYSLGPISKITYPEKLNFDHFSQILQSCK